MSVVRQRQAAPIPKLGFSVAEAVIASSVGRTAILNAINRGELPAKQVGPQGSGRKYVIARPALEAWLGFPVNPEPEPASDAAGDPEPDAALIDPEASSPAQPVPDGPAAPPVEQ